MGESVEPGYVSQSRASLNDDLTVHEEISNGVLEIDMGGGNMINARLYTACFHFKGQDQNKLIKHLSGGERNRVHVAKMLNQGKSEKEGRKMGGNSYASVLKTFCLSISPRLPVLSHIRVQHAHT